MPDDDITIRFLADMGVSWRVVEWLRSHGYDAKHLREEGLGRLVDSDIFAKALLEHRVVLTFDLDFGEIAAFSKGQIVSVIVFRLRNTRTSNVIERLSSVLADTAGALREGAVVAVEESRHRVRRLPIGHSED
jgi:predicted nuclease of predicted toxin-antitoxin system